MLSPRAMGASCSVDGLSDEIVQLAQQLQNAFGNLGIREVQLNAEKEALTVELGKKNQKETEITRKINEKYGVGQIDLQRGVFIASEQ